MATVYLGFNINNSPYTPNRLSTSPYNAYDSIQIYYMTQMDGTWPRHGVNYVIFEVTDVPNAYGPNATMDVNDYWAHDEDKIENRQSAIDYSSSSITQTVHVWSCNEVVPSGEYYNMVPNIETGTNILFFNDFVTYEPEIFNQWIKNGNTYTIQVNANSQWITTSHSLYRNHNYTVTVNVSSEAGWDGVIVTSAAISNTAISNASSCTGYITHGSGNNTTVTGSYTATSTGESIYLYFKTDGSSITPDPETATVTITDNGTVPTGVTVTLADNGGSGGSGQVIITNGTTASNYPSITIPLRSGFIFLGYYDAQSGGTQYYTSSGNGARTFNKTSNCTFYAHWKPIITNSYQDNYIYCTYTAEAYSSMKATDDCQIASYAPSAGAGTLNVSVSSPSGWTLTSDKKGVNVPQGTSAGTYNVTIYMSVNGNAPSYESNSDSVTIEVEVIATSISSYANPVVSHTTPITLDGAGESYTMIPSFSQNANWNNGATSVIQVGGSFSYSTTTSCTGFSRSGATVTALPNDTGDERGPFVVKITCTSNGKSGTKNVSFYQEEGTVITYGDVVISEYSYLWFYARGETRATDTLTYSQAVYTNGTQTSTITSGGTVEYYSSGSLASGLSKESDFSTTGSVTWEDRTNVAGARRDGNTALYVRVTLNGKTGTRQCDECYQEANVLEWTTPSIPSHSTPISIPAAGQVYTCSPTSTQTKEYTSGYVVQTVNVTNFVYAVSTSKTGYSLNTSTGVVTVTNNMSTAARNGFKITIKGSQNGKTSSAKTVTFNQLSGSQGYLNPVITSYSYPYFYASGETQLPNSIAYSQEYAWNGVPGSGTTTSTGGTLTFSSDGSLPSGFNVEGDFSTTGRCTWANRASIIGEARSAEDNLYVRVTMNGKTSDLYWCDSCFQEANEVESLDLSLASTSIALSSSTTGTVTAHYTSNASSVISTGVSFNTNPSNIVSIS